MQLLPCKNTDSSKVVISTGKTFAHPRNGGIFLKIWRLYEDFDTAEALVMEEDEQREAFIYSNFNGVWIEQWGDVRVKTAGKKRKCDVYKFFAGYPIVATRTIEALKNFLEMNAQSLPIRYNSIHSLHIINVLNVLDCLDYKKAEVTKSDSGTVIDIHKYFFKHEKIIDQHIFKIPEKVRTFIFVSDEFKAACEENRLVGLKFIEVWDSDENAALEKEKKFKQLLDEIDRLEGPEYSFDQALRFLDQGKAMVSGNSKLQKNEKGDILIGKMDYSGKYKFLVAIYYPPIFLE